MARELQRVISGLLEALRAGRSGDAAAAAARLREAAARAPPAARRPDAASLAALAAAIEQHGPGSALTLAAVQALAALGLHARGAIDAIFGHALTKRFVRTKCCPSALQLLWQDSASLAVCQVTGTADASDAAFRIRHHLRPDTPLANCYTLLPPSLPTAPCSRCE